MLSKKKLLFCEAYVSNGFNGAKAAIAAGYAAASARQTARFADGGTGYKTWREIMR